MRKKTFSEEQIALALRDADMVDRSQGAGQPSRAVKLYKNNTVGRFWEWSISISR